MSLNYVVSGTNNAIKSSSCQIIFLITFNPLLTAGMESSQATTIHFLSCCSVAKSCPTLCSPMDCSTPGFSVLHYLPEFAQTHVHWPILKHSLIWLSILLLLIHHSKIYSRHTQVPMVYLNHVLRLFW